jgi:hypothetical protein
LDTWLYPGVPVANDLANLDLTFLTSSEVALLASLLGAPAQTSGDALLMIRAMDCEGVLLQTPTVSVKQGGGDVGASFSLGGVAPDVGTALIFNVPPGQISVSASTSGTSLRTNTLTVLAGALTVVDIVP